MVHVSRRTALGGVLALAVALTGLFFLRGDSTAQVAPTWPDHFKCYRTQGPPLGAQVTLEDQFDKYLGIQERAIVVNPARFCNPAAKFHRGKITPITNPDAHLKLYRIDVQPDPAVPPLAWKVVVANQFGRNQTLLVGQPVVLAVPTQKLPYPQPQGLDHFKCYVAHGRKVPGAVHLWDQFHVERGVNVRAPVLFCNPTLKIHDAAGTVTPILNPEAHLVCYAIKAKPFTATVETINQFGTEVLALERADLLCVPSLKIDFAPVTPPPVGSTFD